LKLKLLLYSFSILFLSFVSDSYAQGKFNTPARECLKNVTTFSYAPGSGLTITAAQWDFGDGSSSTNISPQYIFKTPGTYKIKIRATLSNSNQITDSTSIIVVPLPTAKFTMLKTSDTCFNGNVICFKDSSLPGKTGQDITNRLVVWGDGAFANNGSPSFGNQFCHSYAQVDKYTIKIEITDIYGCKAAKTKTISILEQSDAGFGLTNTFKDCVSKNICLKNQTSGKNISSAKYFWFVTGQALDTNRYFNSLKCYTYTSSATGSVKLLVKDANGCKDSLLLNFSVTLDPLPSKLEIKDTVLCFSTLKLDSAWTTPTQSDKVVWLMDNKDLKINTGTQLAFTPKSIAMYPGTHTLTCQITRGNCVTNLSRQVTVKGPIADFKIIDNNQCFTQRKVSFINNSQYQNKSSSKYLWNIYDSYGGKCTTDSKNSNNLNNNCNYSTDYFHDHNFKTPPQSYKITLSVKDTLTGCLDSVTKYVNTRDCNILVDLDSIDICQGEWFDVANGYKNPKFVSLDSGKTWLKFPTKPKSNLSGKMDVYLIYETILPEWLEKVSKDSVRLRKDTLYYYDTLYKKGFLRINSINSDSVTYKQYGNCKPFRSSLFFGTGIFYPGQTLEVDWGNGQSTKMAFTTITKIDSLFKVYNSSAINFLIKVKVFNNKGCERNSSFLARGGKIFSLNRFNSYYCEPTNICLTPRVLDLKTNNYYNDTTLNKYVFVQFPDTNAKQPALMACHYFKKPGMNTYKIFINDNYNCNDTVVDSLFIQNLRAGIKDDAKTIYCNELKQFFDSSTILNYPGEMITQYNWDFGTGKFTNPFKDPFKSLSTSAKEITVTHFVTSKLGCTDTIRYRLNVVGSHPYFRIVDTIACGSLEAIFKNLSENCKGYIWEFGDPDGTVTPINTKQDMTFKYLKPGRYQIRLNGYDSLYNPSTRSTYFCNAIFPDPLFQKDSIRAVVVLPLLKSGIQSIDTICPKQTITFKSLSDPSYSNDYWTFEDTTISRAPGDTVSYSYQKPGKYTVKLSPKYNNTSYNICSDSSSKIITVLDIKADFDIDPNSPFPTVLFKNTSNPLSASMYWNFGEKINSVNNTSRLVHPSHRYAFDTLTYTICLIASSNMGCADTVCKPYKNSFFQDLMVFNVFTPGQTDGYNDRYDVVIEGEKDYHLRIYDRWGVLVYESFEDSDNTTDINWNGRVQNKGPECPAGNYYYIFDYTMKTSPDKNKTINGTVSLIR
jgi:gliding motility-associated-like protein